MDVNEAQIPDPIYFGAIINQMNDGGREALLHFLGERDLAGVNLRKIPATGALFDQKVHSMRSVEQWWYGKLMDGAITPSQESWDDNIHTDAAYKDYIEHAEKIGIRRRDSTTEFGVALKKLAPGVKRKRVREYTKLVYRYTFPPLEECRRAFEELMRMPVPWPKRRGE